MKKVLFALSSVFVLNAATTQMETDTPGSPNGRRVSYPGEYRVCPPGPTRTHPKVMWDASTQEWLRYNKNTGEWDRMPTNQ